MKAITNNENNGSSFGTDAIWKILYRIAPPVIFTYLIQSLYNIVDSYFIGKYSGDGLTALSVIFPIQLVISAVALGTGILLVIISWVVLSVLAIIFIKPYVGISVKSLLAVDYAVSYGTIICVGSLAIFLESLWTKVHQARGDMKLPMMAQAAEKLVAKVYGAYC